MALTTDTRLGPYVIRSRIGAGGMGEVYLASDTRLGRDVAIKVLPADVAADPDRLARFEREARAVSALNHPNIVTLYEVGTSDAGPYLVLEKIEGRSLRDVLAEGPLSIRRILTLATQIAEGIAKAHSAGITHRDLKPDNVMVTGDGFAKVLDFGLAKLVYPELETAPIAETTLVKDTASGVILGTLGYLSPEQAAGKPADFRADQFALGALMYEMATRDRPFHRATLFESLAATIRDEPDPVRSKRPDLPVPFEWVIERCLAKDPNDRYASTADLARDLAALRDRLSDLTRMPKGEPGPTRARVVPRGVAGWAIGAAVVAAVAAGSFVVARRTAPVSIPSFRPLTFQRGLITGARFGSDAQTVYYSAAYGSGPSRIYMTRLDRIESKLLDVPPGFLLAVSAKEELAILLTTERVAYAAPGTLARVPAVGGTPRELVENVTYGDWSSDAEQIAIQRANGSCEFPIGRRVEVPCSTPRVSPDGRHLAFLATTELVIQDVDGQRVSAAEMRHIFGLAWSRDGREVWFTGSETGSAHDRALYVLSLDGRQRLVARAPGAMSVYDVAPTRDAALVATGAGWFGINALVGESGEERSLDHLGRTDIVGLSADGKWVLLDETREVGPGTYLRSTDGEQLVPLTADIGRGLSPDGAFALVQTRDTPPRLQLLPTRAGTKRDVPINPGLEASPQEFARWSPDRRRLFMWLRQAGVLTRAARLHVWENGGAWRAVTPEMPSRPFAVSPDGGHVATTDEAGVVMLFPVGGGQPRRLEGVTGRVVHWTSNGHLVVAELGLFPARLYRCDLATGRVEPWRTLSPADPSGVMFVGRTLIAADDRSYVYQYSRGLNDLYLARELR